MGMHVSSPKVPNAHAMQCIPKSDFFVSKTKNKFMIEGSKYRVRPRISIQRIA
jgi:hypothetical protein